MCFSLPGTDVKKDMEFPTTFMVDGEGGRGVIKTEWSAYEFKPLLPSSDSSDWNKTDEVICFAVT